MNKYLKLFETEDDFKSCLDAKIGGDNTVMGFPNVSVIGEKDNNGNFSASDVFYIKDLNKAQAIRQIFSHWVNPTIVNITNDNSSHNILSIDAWIDSGPSLDAYRFQPYDWYDKNTKTTYYAFISWDAFRNITDSSEKENVNLLSVDTGYRLISGVEGYDPTNSYFSDWSHYDYDNPKFSGRILYVKNLSEINELYQREFSINNGVLVFGDIEPFPYSTSSIHGHFSTNSFDNVIEGYPDAESGSGSGDGN